MANSPLQKAPIGTLQQYNIQTLGQAPTHFGDTVVPVARVDHAYERDLLRRYNGQATIAIGQAAAIAFVTFDVPARVYGVYVNHICPAADAAFQSTVQTRLFIQDGSSGLIVAFQSFVPNANFPLFATAHDRMLPIWFPEPFIMRPGDALQGVVNTSAVATVAHTVVVSGVAAALL